MTSILRSFSSWLGDARRFVWAVLYWNARKSLYVRGGRKGSCPCQDPSEPGRPGETRCEASLYWNKPERFRHVCPLLRSGAAGWRCSVPDSGVQPFWGRAAAFGAAGLLALHLALASTAWVIVASARIDTLSWWELAWPGAWKQVPLEMARHYRNRALHAFAQRDYAMAQISLSTALHYEPASYETDLLLAQIAAFQGSADYSSAAFARLSHQHPGRAHHTALVYLDTLTALGRWPEMAEHSLRMALAAPGEADLWVRSLLVASRLGDIAPLILQRYPAEVGRLAPHAQMLLQATADLQRGDQGAALQRLSQPYLGPLNPLYARQHLEMLLRLGQPQIALVHLGHYGVAFGAGDEALVQYRIDRASGDVKFARADYRAALRQPRNQALFEHLAAVLVAYPDRDLYTALEESVLSPGARTVSAETMWLLAVVNGDQTQARYWASRIERQSRVQVPDIPAIDFRRAAVGNRNTPAYLINAVPLPRTLIYALLERMADEPVKRGVSR